MVCLVLLECDALSNFKSDLFFKSNEGCKVDRSFAKFLLDITIPMDALTRFHHDEV